MTRSFSSCLIAAALWLPAGASGQPSSGPPPAPAPPPAPITLDIVVTDAQHKPVHKLTAADFIVLQDGHPQTIASFEEHNPWEAAAPIPEPPKLPPGAFTNYSIAPTSGSVNILLFDLLNTPAPDQPAVREQILAYLKQVHPGTRMAIFALTSKLVLLQGFTSDAELLSDVAGGKFTPATSNEPASAPPASDSTIPSSNNPDAPPPAADTTSDDNSEPTSGIGNAPGPSQIAAALKQLQAASQPTPITARAHYTLDALNLLAHYLGNLPGHKNLIWFSGSFPINVLPDGSLENPFGVLASAVDQYRETSNLLARGKVAVYPIQSGPATATPDAAAPQSNTAEAMAQSTGGEVLSGSSGIQAAVDKALLTGAHFYTLSYIPSGDNEPGNFRKIRIDTSRQGLSLAYSRGYFTAAATPPSATPSPIAFSSMRIAMAPFGPDPTDIIFTASVFPVAGDPEPDPAPGNKTGDSAHGPFRRYAVQLGIDAHDITCPTDPGGSYRCTLEASILVYDSSGSLLNSAGGPVQTIIPPDQFAGILRDGLTFRQDISIPLKTDAFLRIGVHEQSSNKLGTVEFPISAVAKLKPIPVTPAPATTPQPAPR